MTIQASYADRKAVSARLSQAIADVEELSFSLQNDDGFGTSDEYLNADRYDLELALTEQALSFVAKLKAFRVERNRLAADHASLEAEQRHIERINSRVGYGHLQSELV